MDKNTIVGFVLIALVLIGFSWWSKPSEQELKEKQKQELVQSQNVKVQKGITNSTSSEADTTAALYQATNGTDGEVLLQNSKIALTLNHKGGVVRKAVIKGYQDINGKPDVTLFEGNDQMLNYTIATKTGYINTKDLYFIPSGQSDSTITLTAQDQSGRSIVMEYLLTDTYLLRLKLYVKGMQNIINPNSATLDIAWHDKCKQQEKGFTFENRFASLTYHKAKGGTDYLSESREKINEKIEDPINWVAFKNQFFSAIMISKNDFQADGLLTSIPQEKGSGYLKEYEAKLKTSLDPQGQNPSEFEFFYGPNAFRLLQKINDQSLFGKDLQLNRIVYLGWPLFRIINRWFTLYIFDWLTGLNINMGFVLILITLILKVITYPLVKKSYMSSAKMRVLKPKLEEATKHLNGPDTQMQKQQAMMAEYAKYGVSPLSGCLPMLIQMPIWIAMFNFVPNAIELRGEKFLWIKDLSTYDPIIEWNHNVWLIGNHISLTCILFCISNILYSLMTMRQQRDQMVGQQAQQMKTFQWMMMVMPLMFFFMFNDYSAGLNFYYFVSLLFSAAIMWTLRKTTNDAKLLAILEARYQENKNNPKKLSGFAARLQELQEQQAKYRRRNNNTNN